MKAIVHSKYGSPDLLQLKEVKNLIPLDDEVKIKILCASLNLTDIEIIRGDYIVRLANGLRKPKNPRLGCDFSGIVDAVGKNVTQFKEGDEVYADLMYQKKAYGSFAEFVCVPEKRLRLKPKSMSFEEASTIPQAGVLALQGVLGKSPPQQGQQVLINGAGGGVGTFAIQIAKSFGVEVTGVDLEAKFELMKSLGVDHVIDYTKEDYSKQNLKFDLILDVIAKRSLRTYRRALNPDGQYKMVGGTLGQIFQIGVLGTILSKFSNKKVGLLVGKPNNKNDMDKLTELYEAKKVIPVIDKIFPLEEAPNALKYLQDGHSKGKVVIKIQ